MPLADKDTDIPYSELAENRLLALAERYLLGEAAFESRPHPGRAAGSEYDHLARIAEWAVASEEGP
jgi:hypothetical protein